MSLNMSLDNLPARPLDVNHVTVTAWLDQRRAKALKIASNTLELADTVKNYGDFDAAAELIHEAVTYLTEANTIAALRKVTL